MSKEIIVVNVENPMVSSEIEAIREEIKKAIKDSKEGKVGIAVLPKGVFMCTTAFEG